MILQFLEHFRAKRWNKPGEVKNFSWSPDSTSAFARWSSHRDAVMDDLPQAWLFQGTMLGADLWDSIHHWWNRYPEHFGIFWATVQQQPRQKWSQAALRTLAKHVPVDEVRNLVESALLCDDGRAWLLANKDYGIYLRNISQDQVRQWVRSTTYSMPSLFEAFDSLTKLQLHMMEGPNASYVADALAQHYQEQEHLDPSTNTAKAWVMTTPELNHWMDDDKQLPFWFDPVNRDSWKQQCQKWLAQTNYQLSSTHPLRAML